MATVQVRIKSGPTSAITLDRVPAAGEYIAGKDALFRVVATVFTPSGGGINAVLFVENDLDGKPDEIGLMPSHL